MTDSIQASDVIESSDASVFCRMQGISKQYGGVTALDNVNFQCAQNSIHAVLGENGAGKSTLIKILSGVVQPSQGELFLQGRRTRFVSPNDATRQGIVCIFQELSLLPDLSVADNISITDPPKRFGLIDRKAQNQRALELLAQVGCEDVHPQQRVRSLSLSRRQMVEIAKALNRKPKLLILDEATSALTAADVEKVYTILHKLRDQGLSILYISHRMHEIEALADVCSVFRNGRHIETFKKGDKGDDEVVELMIGREYSQVYPPKPQRTEQPAPILDIDRLSWSGRLRDISLTLGRGETVGLGGLDGQGQREFLLALFGVLRGVSGTIKIDGEPASINSPRVAKSARYGLALIPEDRKTEGLLLPMSVRANISLASIGKLSRGITVDQNEENRKIDSMLKQLSIKIGNVEDPVSTLSGGNQQKVVIAKWLMTEARIILLNDPTRGIDVGTKQEIYQLLRKLADQGVAILFYSTDYEELIGCCDRVAIFYDGQLTRELSGASITEHNIVASSLNLPLEATLPEEQAL